MARSGPACIRPSFPVDVLSARPARSRVVGRPRSVGKPGRDSRGILEACANREIDVLYLVGVDPLRDFPDGALALRALENVPVKIVQSLELGSLEPFADAFLPAAPFLEKEGHVTNWEGRGQRLRRVRDPEGMSLPDWEIFASLALACGGDLGFETLDDLHEEMGELLAPQDAPDHRSHRRRPTPTPPPRMASRSSRTRCSWTRVACRNGPTS